MLSVVKDAIEKSPVDGLIYLAKKLSDTSGFFVSDKHLLYIVKNFDHESAQNISTEFINLHTNVEVQAFADGQQFETGKYNILDFIPTEDGYNSADLESFVNLCSAHALYMNSAEFVKFFYSLINIFQYPAEQEYKNLVGLFGELSVIKFIHEQTGQDVSAFWHKAGSNGKYDFVLDSLNIEVKSSAADSDEVAIKHNQIFNNDNNYLAVVSLEKNNAGISTSHLINELLTNPDYCNNYSFSVNVEKERKRISPTDAENVFFTVKSITFYRTVDINPFLSLPDEVRELTYKLDISSSDAVEVRKMLEG